MAKHNPIDMPPARRAGYVAAAIAEGLFTDSELVLDRDMDSWRVRGGDHAEREAIYARHAERCREALDGLKPGKEEG